MKSEEKRLAREMRHQGHSYSEILSRVGVSKSTLSLWLRDIALGDEQLLRLTNKQCVRHERFRQALRNQRLNRWAAYHEEARCEFETLSRDPAFMFGLALYVGEGDKSSQNRLCLSNCDPRVVRRGLEFYASAGVPIHSIRCQVHLHMGLDKDAALAFWQDVTHLPITQFHSVVQAVSRASGQQKGNLQLYGTCHLFAFNTKMRQKVGTWMDLALHGPIVQR